MHSSFIHYILLFIGMAYLNATVSSLLGANFWAVIRLILSGEHCRCNLFNSRAAF